jgi:NitT/TauT family transport system substrate-binding protein
MSSYENAKRAIPLCNIRYVGAFALEREINRYLNIFYEFNPESIGGKIPDRDFIYQ